MLCDKAAASAIPTQHTEERQPVQRQGKAGLQATGLLQLPKGCLNPVHIDIGDRYPLQDLGRVPAQCNRGFKPLHRHVPQIGKERLPVAVPALARQRFEGRGHRGAQFLAQQFRIRIQIGLGCRHLEVQVMIADIACQGELDRGPVIAAMPEVIQGQIRMDGLLFWPHSRCRCLPRRDGQVQQAQIGATVADFPPHQASQHLPVGVPILPFLTGIELHHLTLAEPAPRPPGKEPVENPLFDKPVDVPLEIINRAAKSANPRFPALPLTVPERP